MNPENEKQDIKTADNNQESTENKNQENIKSLDDFGSQKENILKNSEYKSLEEETPGIAKGIIDKIINDFKDTNNPQKEKNQEILNFLKKDNNLQKIFDEYAETMLKGKEGFEKEMELTDKGIGYIKTKIESDFSKSQDKEKTNADLEKTNTDLKNQELFKNIKSEYETLQKKSPIQIDKSSPEYQKLLNNDELKSRLGDNFEDFITYKYAAKKIAEEVQNSPDKKVSRDKYEFIKSFNEIADKYGQEPINMEGWTPIDTPTNTVKEFSDHPNTSAILEKNDNIKNYIDSQESNVDLGNQEIIQPDNIQKRALRTQKENIKKEINDKYHQDAFDKLFNDKGEKIKDNREKIPPNVQNDINNIVNKYAENAQSELNNSLKKLVVSKSVSGSTNEFVKYFNFDKANNYGDMSFDTNSINIQDNKLQTTMGLDGSKTTFNYDLKTGEIKYSDFLNISDNKNIVNINNKFENFPISFPSIDSIEKKATEQIINQENISKNLENSNSIEDFYQKYSEDIGNIEVNNQESPYIKVVIEHTIQKNNILKKTSELIKQFSQNKNTYDNVGDKEMVKLYKTLDESFNTYSTSDMKRFDNCISILTNEIKQNQLQANPNADIIAKTLFSPNKQERDQKEEYKKGEKDMGPSMTEFFTAISEKDGNTNTDIVNLNVFDNIVEKREKNEKIDLKNEKIIKLAEKCDNYNSPNPVRRLEDSLKPLPDAPSK